MKRQSLIDMKEEFLLNEKFDEKSKSTQIHYEHVIDMFLDSLKNDEVSKTDFMKFKSYLMDNFKPSTVNNYIIIINKFIKYYEIVEKYGEFEVERLKKWTSKNTLKLVRIQKKSSLNDVLEPDEFKRMLRMAKKMNRMDMYMIMKIFAYTGIRTHELEYFTYENIQSNYIEVRNKGKIRQIILRNDLKNELQKYCEDNGIDSGHIFKGRKEGQMMHPSTIYKNLKVIAGNCRGIKLEKIHPHSFRHLFATQFMKLIGDVTELADILGHSSVDTTAIYTKTPRKMQKKDMEIIKY